MVAASEKRGGLIFGWFAEMHHLADKDEVIAAIVVGMRAAFEHGQRRMQHRTPGDALAVRDIRPLIQLRSGEAH